MSRSPEEAGIAGDAVSDYRQGWSALSELIGQGKSFSGYERNCAFLNVPGGGFATISSTSGLDFIDDGRAVATCDWDGDGQLDFWVTNRTAPRVRFLRNISHNKATGTSVQLGLRGVTCNRDAIGARVEVYCRDQERPVIRTLHAGDGFLAQSSKWLHFGLGQAEGVARVIVRWPGDDAEVFTGVGIQGHYILTQGTGEARPRDAATIARREVPPAPEKDDVTDDGSTRTWIVGRVPMPETEHVTPGQAVLLNLWSSTCSSCVSELAEWTANETAIRQAGLDVVALSVDDLGGEGSDTAQGRFLDKINFPFHRGNASRELVNAMEIVHRTFIERQAPLPVPASFLLDTRGRVAAIYKGRVPLDTLLEDAELLNADLPAQRAAAVPYAGRWASKPFPPNPNRIAAAFEKAGQEEEAIAYLKHFLKGARHYLEDQYGNQEQQLATVVVAHQWLGDLLAENDRLAEAARVYANLLKLAPQDVTLHQAIGERLLTGNLAQASLPHLLIAARGSPRDANVLFNTGLAALGSGQIPAAIAHFQRALAISPQDKATHYQLAVALELAGRNPEAARHCRAALEREPGWPIAISKLIELILKSQETQAVGTLEEALALAETLCERTSRRDPLALHTLARVHAADHQGEKALAIIDEAIPLAQSSQQKPLLRALMALREAVISGK